MQNTATVINDLHIGTLRSAGTTPATAYELRRNLLFNMQGLLSMADDTDLLVLGDLFDTPNIPLSDLFATVMQFTDWLRRNPNSHLWLPPGNHDLSKNSQTYTSFDTLAALLQASFEGRVHVPRIGESMGNGMWVLGHVANQDIFELELSRVPTDTKYLFLHCNYSNNFAAKSDHSLNLSEDQTKTLPAQHIFIAHEHQQKVSLGGKVVVIGNQFPSSVSDCLGNATKRAVVVSEAGYQSIQTWSAGEDFAQLDWQLLEDTGASFIRVIGKASAAEGAAVVAAISKLRQASKALVITNAVEIEGETNEAEIALTMEKLNSFDVMTELMKLFNEEEKAVITGLLEKNSV